MINLVDIQYREALSEYSDISQQVEKLTGGVGPRNCLRERRR